MRDSFGHSFPVGRLFGIPVSMHWSLPVLVLAYTLHDLSSYGLSMAWLSLVVGVMAAFSVLFHELGHALTAHQFGQRTRSIDLHAFGGVAQISGGTASAHQSARNDVIIALAGPCSNFLLSGLLTALSTAFAPVGYTAAVLHSVARFNLMIGVFNLLPCYPLDGGRALLGALRLKMGPMRGDRLAFTVGLYLAVPGMMLGILWSQPVMTLLFYIAFDACRQHRSAIDASFGGARVVNRFSGSGPTLWERVRGAFSRPRDPQPPKLRVIKGGRFDEGTRPRNQGGTGSPD